MAMSNDLRDWYSKMNSDAANISTQYDTARGYEDIKGPEEEKDVPEANEDKAFIIASYIDRGLPFFNEYFRLLIEDLLSKSKAGFPRELRVVPFVPGNAPPVPGPDEINKKALADNKQAFIKFIRLLNSLATELERGN